MTRNLSTGENVQKLTRYFLLFFRRVRATSMTQRRVENTRVHFWTFSRVSVKSFFVKSFKDYLYFSTTTSDKVSLVYLQPGCTISLLQHGLESWGGWEISKVNRGTSELKWLLDEQNDNQASKYRCECKKR